jgi:dipeptidyl aminopeptidase/acylaminoacyl peptidase
MPRIVSTTSYALLAAVLACTLGCPRQSAGTNGAGGPVDVQTGPVTFPELGASRAIQPGIQFQEATIQRAGVPMRVWVYLPEQAGAEPLPWVMVPPAGSTLLAGMDLSDGDRPEHYPYVRAGFGVVSFEIDGHVRDMTHASDEEVIRGARAFMAAQAGLANARTALEFALAKVPKLDARRIYVAGHSSAATLALLFASHEPRIKACAAYAPVTDVEDRLRPAVPSFKQQLPGLEDFLRSSSPKTHADRLKCPVFLFYALDDKTVPTYHSTNFAEQLKKTNPQVTVVSTPRGGHYESMLREGLPKGIEWFKSLK